MRRMKLFSIIGAFILLVLSGNAFADTYPSTVLWSASWSVYGVSNKPSSSAACSALGSQINKTLTVGPYDSGLGMYPCLQGETKFGYANASYSCPFGGTVSGSNCINAPACLVGETRNATTGKCEPPPPPVACNTAGTTTTSGATQTFTWETSPTGLSPCEPHSISCDYPLVVNTTDKRCDLSCPDGSTVNVSAGQQCSHECQNQVNGSIITIRTWDELTQACKNTSVKQCDRQMQNADAVSGDCLPKPGATDCGNGIVVIAPVECSSKPDESKMITCSNGIKIYPPRVCSPLPPKCESGTPGFYNGVPVCYGADGSATPAPDGSQTPPDDKYNPQEYKPGVACNSSYSYPCDPSLPINTLPAVTGIETCGPATFFTCVDQHTKPVVPTLYPKEPTPTATQSTGTSTTTTTYTHNDGTTSTSVATTNITGSSTTIGKTTTDCPDCAKESTLREIVNRIGKSSRSGTAWQPGNGSGPPSDTNAEQISSKKAAVSSMLSDIKGQMSGLIPSVSGGASISCDDGVHVMGITFNICLAPYTEQLAKIGIGVYVAAVVLSVMIILG